MSNSNERGISIVPAAITIGIVAAMIVLIGQVTLRPWAGTDNGFDTHLNYATVSDDYSRSPVGRVGETQNAPDGWTPANEIAAGDTQAAWVGYGCASCHGLDGTGGLVGPNLQELVRDDFSEKIRFGQDGMPAFAEIDLTDEHIALISDYLIEVGGPPPTPTPIPPTPVPTSTPAPAPTSSIESTPTESPVLTTATPESGDGELIAMGKLLYEETAGASGCAECHGFNAEGGGPGSANAPSIRGTTASKIRRSIDDAFDMNDIELSSNEMLALEAYLALFKTDE